MGWERDARGGRKEERGSDAKQIRTYSPKAEAQRILDLRLQLRQEFQLPDGAEDKVKGFEFTTEKDQVYFPIPFAETETTAALKAQFWHVSTRATNWPDKLYEK
jgi:hypothetical protein